MRYFWDRLGQRVPLWTKFARRGYTFLFFWILTATLAFSSLPPCDENGDGCIVPGWDDPIVISPLDERIPKDLSDGKGYITLFYTHDCPRCHEAMDYLQRWKSDKTDLDWVLQFYEISESRENQQRLQAYLKAYEEQLMGVPIIFIGSKTIHGFQKGYTETRIQEAVAKLTGTHDLPDETITLPLIGVVDPSQFPLLAFTVIIGLLDGFNPCAMWVLMFLLGLLIHARSRRKMLTIGLIFVAASGVVYFGFMAAWFNLFVLLGLSRIITIVLAAVVMIMGAINIKEVFMFKKGPSLMIPEKQKDKLFQKMRKVVQERNTLLAIVLTVGLAFFVNLIELACTIGLPAIFTKTLADRQIPEFQKWGHLVLYNVVYVVPLLIIVLLFTVTMGGKKLQEKHAKILKLMSGVLMFGLGIFLLIR